MGFLKGQVVQESARADARIDASAMDGASAAEGHQGNAVLINSPIRVVGSPDIRVFRGETLTICADGRPRWAGARDASTALAAFALEYQRKGVRALCGLGGPFALVIHEPQRRRTTLAIDRMGIRPLAYGFANGGELAFASTASAVAARAGINTSVRMQSVYDYLYCQIVPSPTTIYEGVRKLEPATCLVYENGSPETIRYWMPSYGDSGRTLRELEEELREVLCSAVRRCDPDESTGSFLSGGVDSSTVAGMLQGMSDRPVSAYTIGFRAEGYDELGFARGAAEHFGLDFRSYYVTERDVAEAIAKIAGAYDEPFGNSSAIAVFLCARLAASDGKRTLLAGDGGDELFAGNARYAKQKLFEMYGRVPAILRTRLLAPLAARSSMPSFLPLHKLQSYVRQASVPMPARMDTYNIMTSRASADILHDAFAGLVDVHDPERLMAATYELPSSRDLLHRMLFYDWKYTLADNDLRKVNRMCEINGVEVRYPLLDEHVVDFSLKVPPRWLLKGRKLRFFFKHALRDFLPRSALTKSKHGFGVPFGAWLASSKELQDVVNASLASLKTRNLLKPEFIDLLLREHSESHATYYGSAIWPLIALEQWLQSRSIDLRL